jgi:hypothetical protein
MEKHYHILNGDALKKQFPEEIGGEVMVVGECLVARVFEYRSLP